MKQLKPLVEPTASNLQALLIKRWGCELRKNLSVTVPGLRFHTRSVYSTKKQAQDILKEFESKGWVKRLVDDGRIVLDYDGNNGHWASITLDHGVIWLKSPK